MANETPPSDGHEFTTSENRTIGGLASMMSIVGIVLLLLGVVKGVVHGYAGVKGGFTAGPVIGLIEAVLYLVLALWTLDAPGRSARSPRPRAATSAT